MASTQALKELGFDNRLPKNSGAPTSVAHRAAEAQERLSLELTRFFAEMEVAKADPRLTSRGKADRVHALVRDFLDVVGSIDAGGIEPLRRVRAEARRALSPKAPGAEDAGRVLRELSVLHDLRAMTESERTEIIARAVATGDELVYAAFSNAPGHVKLVNPQIGRQFHEEWAARTNPAVAAQLREAEGCLAVLDENLADVRRVADEFGPPPDPRAGLRQVSQR